MIQKFQDWNGMKRNSIMIDWPLAFGRMVLSTAVETVSFEHVEQNDYYDHQNWHHQQKEDQESISQGVIYEERVSKGWYNH